VRRKPKAQSPVLVLGAAGDTLATPSDMRSTARHYGCEATMIDGVAHDMMLDVRWQKTADTILSWLRKQTFAQAGVQRP
jgi:alpha-beta hydrolase superfamily lysophospholipase